MRHKSPVGVEFGRAITRDERRDVQHLRYRVYVEEMGRYRGRADHEERLLVEPEDEHSWLFYARDGDEVVGAGRVTWGGDGFSDRQIDQYRLAPFLDELPAELLAVGERMMVLPHYRGTDLMHSMMESGQPFLDTHDVRAVFGCCEPHLLGLYIGMGQRPYADRNINSDEAGYLIPLVSFVPDENALRGVARDRGPDELPRCVERALAGAGSVRSSVLLAPDDYLGEIRSTLEQLHAQPISAFDGLTDDEAQRCVARSNIVECDRGDRLLKRGSTARNIFVVLAGTLEVFDDGRLVGVLGPGDVFGEMAFLLERPRTFDVDAATDGVRVLSLSEGALRKMIAEDPVVAAKLLMNVARMLCLRLIKAD
jgi:hypothetical protein